MEISFYGLDMKLCLLKNFGAGEKNPYLANQMNQKKALN